MKPENLLADISRRFLGKHDVYKYRLRKIDDMSDEECITSCHFFCEENKLTDEFIAFRAEIESEYTYCQIFSEYIGVGLCVDIQMVANGYIKKSILKDYGIGVDKAIECCENCADKF